MSQSTDPDGIAHAAPGEGDEASPDPRWRASMPDLSELVALVDAAGDVRWANAAFDALLGRVTTGQPLASLLGEAGEALPRPDEGNAPWQGILTLRDGRGGRRELSATLEPLGAAATWLLVARDVDAERRSRARQARLGRALRVLRAANRALVGATDEASFLTEVCRLLVDLGGYRLAWVGLAEPSPGSPVRPAARAGEDHGYVDSVQATWDESERGQGPVGRAIRSREPVAVKDLASDPRFAPWREEARRRGFGSTLAVPLLTSDDAVLGALAIYAPEPDAFDPEEEALLCDLADGMVHGLETLRTRDDRAAAMEALRESGLRFRQIMDNIREVFWMVSVDGGEVLYISPAFEQLFGLSREAIYRDPESFLTHVHPDDVPLLRDLLLKMPGDTEVEYRMRRADGAWRWVRNRVFPVRSQNGEILRVAGVSEDVTDRREADTERRHLESELQLSRRMESVGRLAGGIAHDFNNLLSVILNYGEVMRRRLPEGDPLRDEVREIQGAAERGVALTRQLLLFSRRDTEHPDTVDVNALIEEMRKLLARTLGEDVKLEMQLDPALERVRIDYTHLEQVVLNLAVNARDAMPEGGTLTVGTSMVEVKAGRGPAGGLPPGSYACLRVADSGTGMAPEVAARAFEPFFTTKEVGAGSGMGLAMAYGVVRRAGGQVRLDSRPGRGTAVEVLLPATEDRASPRPPANLDTGPRGAGELLLLVEDEPALRSLMARMLAENGYRVLEAPGPGEALLLHEREPGHVDLLVTDVIMPLMSGPELARRLVDRQPDLGVLYMSGYAENLLSARGGLDPDVPVLAKPFREAELLRRVRETLDRPVPARARG